MEGVLREIDNVEAKQDATFTKSVAFIDSVLEILTTAKRQIEGTIH